MSSHLPAFLEKERRDKSAAWFAQEYLAEFVDNGQSVFSLDQIEAAIDNSFDALKF